MISKNEAQLLASQAYYEKLNNAVIIAARQACVRITIEAPPSFMLTAVIEELESKGYGLHYVDGYLNIQWDYAITA